jgi:molybdenum cofactor biosynthesis protein B
MLIAKRGSCISLPGMTRLEHILKMGSASKNRPGHRALGRESAIAAAARRLAFFSPKERYADSMSDVAVRLDGPTPTPLSIAVVTVSDSRTWETDKSGDELAAFVSQAGHHLASRKIIKDSETEIRELVRSYTEDPAVQVVLVTGGTGITGRDVTPEALLPLITKEIPGFGELFRMLSYEDIGAATIQSRAFAALCSTTLVFALPGSTSAVRFAVDKIVRAQLDVRTKPCNFAQLMERLSER